MKKWKEDRQRAIRKYRMGTGTLLVTLAGILLIAFLIHRLTGEPPIIPVHTVMIFPFVLLLLSIAVLPFVNRPWWDRRYPVVAFGLAAVVAIYYFVFLGNGPRLFLSASEYFSFMALIGSLFVVSGGIHIKIKGRATPLANTLFFASGAVLANLFGTTGASMVLIRPFMKSNKYRLSAYHIVFFIFIISNAGGMLTPIGDPPLFLGYLKGVPFFWISARIWPIWIIANGLILSIFYLIDRHNFKKLPDLLEYEIEEEGEHVFLRGYGNCVFLTVILCAVFLPPPFREIIMILSALASALTTHGDVHDRNDFNFGPLKEVAILFAGIFATMTPAMDWLALNAANLGIKTPGHYYWGSGALSSFLDNAPTYLNFLSAACGLHGINLEHEGQFRALLGLVSSGDLAQIRVGLKGAAVQLTAISWKYVLAVSAGSVMFGAMTYIGNGPNFMVKSIAEQAHVRMPSFFGYMAKFSLPILLPVFILVWLLFFQ